MTQKLSQPALARAIDHLSKFGDTDVFPHLIELVFLEENKTQIVDELTRFDIDQFQPAQAVESIYPKSQLGFRTVHQLNYLDALLFTAAVIEIGQDLEGLKTSVSARGPFAYRFDLSSDPSLFAQKHNYRDWLLELTTETLYDAYTHVVMTDIADFYSRIYLHRIENTLSVATQVRAPKSLIIRIIKSIRTRQSHGIPVGGSASRLIAEAVLADTDTALLDKGYVFSRFVDDYRLFIKPHQTPYAALTFLAQQLASSEGLTLNAQKTRILSLDDFQQLLSDDDRDDQDAAEKEALDALSNNSYFEEAPVDPSELASLKALNLVAMLEATVEEEHWDTGRIRSLFRALRLTQDGDAVLPIMQNLERYVPFMKEVVLLC